MRNFLAPFSRVLSRAQPVLPGNRKTRGLSTESLEQEVQRLRRAVAELSILNDLALNIGAMVDPQDMVEKLVDTLLRAVNAQQAVVTLVDQVEGDPTQTGLRVMASSADHQKFHMNDSLLGWMYLHKAPLRSNDPNNDKRFKRATWDETVHSIMCVPLLVKGELIGILTCCNKKGSDGFTEEDQQLLAIIAAQSAQIMDNARLYRESASIQEQVRVAYQIQRNLLPKEPPIINGYDIAGTSVPAQTVGGDYFDFIPIEDGWWAICLGDVSGKGLPASLLMANLQATLRGQTLVNSPVHETIKRSNTLMYESTDDENFVTLFYGLLDVSRHQFSFCNAGHEHPFLLSGRGNTRLDSGGIALAVLDEAEFHQQTVTLNAGDVVVIFSDGITDATNRFDEPFGQDSLSAIIEQHKDKPASRIIEEIMSAVNRHAGDAPQLDDLTLVVMRRCS